MASPFKVASGKNIPIEIDIGIESIHDVSSIHISQNRGKGRCKPDSLSIKRGVPDVMPVLLPVKTGMIYRPDLQIGCGC